MKVTTYFFIFVASLLAISSCKKNEAPKVETLSVSQITYSTALASGKIIDSGTEPITQYGVCWTEGSKKPTVNDEKITKYENESEFSVVLENLKPATIYLLRAYASNSIGISYGNSIFFSTPAYGTPVVNTHQPTDITLTSVISRGEIIDNSGKPILAYGFCWKNNDTNPTINDNKIEVQGEHIGQFSLLIDNLEPSSIYYLKAYAINDLGISYGQEIMFYTNSEIRPEVTTNPVGEINHNSALGGGTVVDTGSYQITAYGLVWCLAPSMPSINDNKIEILGAVNQFNLWLTDLEANKLYRVRAYVKNQLGVSYGQEVDFKTNFETVTDINGNAYRIAQIGEQVWMIDNYKATHFRDGTPIPNQTEDAFWDWMTNPPAEPAYCWYDNDYETYGIDYGALYNWPAANHPLLPPEGWHLPSREEMRELMNHLGGHFIGGGKMKETGYSYWDPPNTAATNSSNFSGKGGGGRSRIPGDDANAGKSSSLKINGIFWSSTYFPGIGSIVMTLYHNNPRVGTDAIGDISSGFSVRFIKDQGLKSKEVD